MVQALLLFLVLDNGSTNFVKMITADDDYYAKSGDQVILTIKANETLVQGNFDNDASTSEAAYMVFNVGQSTNVTVTPSLSGIAGNNSSEFSATVTINDDNETSNTNVDFSITGIYDRAGNETSITSNVPTIGEAVYYDSNNPSVETMEHIVPDNNNNPNRLEQRMETQLNYLFRRVRSLITTGMRTSIIEYR